MQKDFKLWAIDQDEAGEAIDVLDEYADRYGCGANAVQVWLADREPRHLPFDTVFLTDQAIREARQQYFILSA